MSNSTSEQSLDAKDTSQEQVSRLKQLATKPEFGIFIALLLLSAFFGIMTGRFFTVRNFFGVLRQTSTIGIMAIGMTILITSQEFDLSVGSIYALNAVIAGLLVRDFGINIWIAALICLGVAVFIGIINGLITVKFGIPSFIVTLGTMMLFRGFALVLSDGWPISGLPESSFYRVFGGRVWIIPMQAVWFVIIAIIGYIILQKSKFGYKVYATGGNREAAELSGIDTDRVKIIGFILTAGAATISALTSLGYLGSISPTQGEGFELMVIAASVVGGTNLFGGAGTILGAFLGASIIGIVRNGLVLMGTGAYWQRAMIGLVIVIAVIVNVQIAKQREA